MNQLSAVCCAIDYWIRTIFIDCQCWN